MTTITRERVSEIIHAAGLEPCDYEEVFGSIKTGEIVAMARIALASLEAEPVACPKCNDTGMADSGGVQPWGEPISVPCDCTAQPALAVDADDNFYSWFGREWHEHYQHNQYTTAAKQMLGVMAESAWKAGSRAAMLQGAKPVTTANKLPFEQWLSQQTGTIDVECGCVMTEVFFHWLRVAYEAGNSPVTPDGWVLVPEEPTHEMLEAGDEQFGTYDVYRRMIAASPQQK